MSNTISRDKNIDSTKGILIILVVFGHFLETIISLELAKSIYTFIYIFHMPAFICITGLFSKKTIKSNSIKKLSSSLLIPFIIFTIIYESTSLILTGSISWYTKSMAPYWILWFLLSLFFWRLFSSDFIKIPFPVISSIIISIILFSIPYIGYTAGLGRTLTFFPFFLIGLIYGSSIIKHVKSLNLYYTIIALLILSISFYLFNDWSISMLYGSQSFQAQKISFENGAILKLETYFISMITMLCFFIVALKTTAFSYFGKASLQIYLWHGLFIILYKNFKLINIFSIFNPHLQIIILFIFSILTAFLLSSNFIKRQTENILSIPYKLSIKKNMD